MSTWLGNGRGGAFGELHEEVELVAGQVTLVHRWKPNLRWMKSSSISPEEVGQQAGGDRLGDDK